MNHSGSRLRVRTTRSTPSPPTPKCRSHSAATKAGVSSSSSSKSGTTTKSFPVPCPLANRIAPMLVGWFPSRVPAFTTDDRERAFDKVRSGRHPDDSRIASEPRLLAPDEAFGREDSLRGRFLFLPLAGEEPQHLGVAEGPAGGPARAQACSLQLPDFVHQAALPHPGNPDDDALVEDAPRHLHPDLHDGVDRLVIGQRRAERPARQLDDLKCPDDP